MQRIIGWICLIVLWPAASWADSTTGHNDPVASVIFIVTLIFFLALIGRELAHRLNQPGVLGELLMGVLVGNLCYLCGSQLIVILREGSAIFNIMKALLGGMSLSQSVISVIPNPFYAQEMIHALSGPESTEYLKIAYIVDIFSRYGVIFLLFMVGLESSVNELKKTGVEAFRVAIIGIIAPMILGFVVAALLIPEANYHTDLFIAATLSATSIGITARVLSQLNKLKSPEAHTILGAAMLDDVLGLIILAVVSSLVISGEVNGYTILRILGLSTAFFVGVLVLAPIVLRRTVALFHFLEPWETKLFISFLFVMILSWLASVVQLAAIVGAFVAGVILNDAYFKNDRSSKKNNQSIRDLVAPLESILAPIFFMMIGLQVKLETFYSKQVLILASGLILAAILGKLICGLGANAKDDKLLIGIGMLPRGEVGLVFASIGRSLEVISDDLFSAIVLMVIVTTFIAPPLLKARYARIDKVNSV